ncbi:MAG: HupE/UreJ family protein, partial [Paracoccaceae bacterium]
MFPLLHKLACALALSTALAAQAAAHEVRPAIADVTVAPATVDMVIRLPLEPLLAGMNLAVLEN